MDARSAVLRALTRYATFSGRARRAEYWWFQLFAVTAYAAAAGIDSMTRRPVVGLLVLLGLAVPSLAVTVRRLHDTGRSGASWLVGLIPFVGPFILLAFVLQDSAGGPNGYGPSPSSVTAPGLRAAAGPRVEHHTKDRTAAVPTSDPWTPAHEPALPDFAGVPYAEGVAYAEEATPARADLATGDPPRATPSPSAATPTVSLDERSPAVPGAASPSPPPPRRRSGAGAWAAAGVGAVIVAAVSASLWGRSTPQTVAAGQPIPAGSPSSSGDAASTATPAASPVTAEESTPTPSTPSVDPEKAALQELEQMRDTALQDLSLDGRWVAQLASKSVGTTDPLQVAANGSHTFYAADILQEVQASSARVSGSVFLLESTDFGKSSLGPGGQPYWVTIADEGFTNAPSVQAWCASTFSDLDAAHRADACVARTLTPPR